MIPSVDVGNVDDAWFVASDFGEECNNYLFGGLQRTLVITRIGVLRACSGTYSLVT